MKPRGFGNRWTMVLAATAVCLQFLWAGDDLARSGRAAPPNSLAGSTVAPDKDYYVAGQSNACRLAVTNASTDAEFLTGVQVSFPAGWVIGELLSQAQACLWPVGLDASGLGTSQALFIDPHGLPGEVPFGCTWHIDVTLFVPAGTTGDQAGGWSLSGGGMTPSPPHDVSGSFDLSVAQAAPALRVNLPLVTHNLVPGPLFSDDFGDPGSGWPAFDEYWGKGSYLGGEYQLLLRQTRSAAFGTPDLILPASYRVEVDARQVSSHPGAYALMFGASWAGNRHETYQFVVSPDTQQYLLEKRSLDGNWRNLIDWTYHPAIHAGPTSNRLRVDRSGTAISLYANGVLLAATADSELSGPGRDAGLRAYSYDTAPVDMRFDNFVVHQLP